VTDAKKIYFDIPDEDARSIFFRTDRRTHRLL